MPMTLTTENWVNSGCLGPVGILFELDGAYSVRLCESDFVPALD